MIPEVHIKGAKGKMVKRVIKGSVSGCMPPLRTLSPLWLKKLLWIPACAGMTFRGAGMTAGNMGTQSELCPPYFLFAVY